MSKRHLPLTTSIAILHNAGLLIAILLIANSCRQATSPPAISGHMNGLQHGPLFLYILKGESFDPVEYDTISIPVIDGTFKWVPHNLPSQQLLLGTEYETVPLFWENNDLQIHGHADSLEQLTITGSVSQSAFEAYRRSVAAIRKEARYLGDIPSKLKAKRASIPERELDSILREIMPRYDSLVALDKAITENFIAGHKNSMVSVYIVDDLTFRKDPAYLDSLFRLLDPEVVAGKDGQYVKHKLGILMRGVVGQPFRDFAEADVKADTVRLADFKGKYLFVHYWTGYMAAENQELVKLYWRYKGRGLAVMGVWTDNSNEMWKEWVAMEKLPWTEVSDVQPLNEGLVKPYGVKFMPDNFLIDPQGVIIGRKLSMEELEKTLAEVLK